MPPIIICQAYTNNKVLNCKEKLVNWKIHLGSKFHMSRNKEKNSECVTLNETFRAVPRLTCSCRLLVNESTDTPTAFRLLIALNKWKMHIGIRKWYLRRSISCGEFQEKEEFCRECLLTYYLNKYILYLLRDYYLDFFYLDYRTFSIRICW